MYAFWPQLFLTIHLPPTSCRCITPLPQWLCRWNNRVVRGMRTLFPLSLPWLHIALVIAETLTCRGEDDLLSLSWWTCWNTFSSAEMQVHGVEEEERFSSIYQGWLVYKQLLPECLPSPVIRVLVLPAAPLRAPRLVVVCKSCLCFSNYCSITGVNLQQNSLWLKTWNLRIYVFMHVSRDLPGTDSTLVVSRTVEGLDVSEVQCQLTLIWKGCNFVFWDYFAMQTKAVQNMIRDVQFRSVFLI